MKHKNTSNNPTNINATKGKKSGRIKPFLITFFAAIIIFLIFVALISGDTEKEKPESVPDIVEKYFPGAEIEYHDDTKNLYFSVITDDDASIDIAVTTNGADLARCVGEIMQYDPETNIQDVTISSETFPQIITCIFNPEVLKSITDWENYTQSDIEGSCLAYSDGTM